MTLSYGNALNVYLYLHGCIKLYFTQWQHFLYYIPIHTAHSFILVMLVMEICYMDDWRCFMDTTVYIYYSSHTHTRTHARTHTHTLQWVSTLHVWHILHNILVLYIASDSVAIGLHKTTHVRHQDHNILPANLFIW